MRWKNRLSIWVVGFALVCVNAFAGSSATGAGLQLSKSIQLTKVAKITAQPTKLPRAETAYQIDKGDSVSITVYQEPDLSITGVKVSTDGTIAFPLLGDLHIVGLSSSQLQKLVTERLKDGYLKSPSVTVSIDRYRLYYIKGEVNSPGGYNYVDGLTIEKAVALAGGFSERASEQDITLVHEAKPDQPRKAVALTTPIRPGDVITVGESFF